MALTTGTRLGPYEITGSLGAGGMGEVYRARDTRLERTVAIKVLPEHLSASPELKQRFEREARAISALSHPHICTLHDIGSKDGVDYLVMEYLDGETLENRLRRGPLPLDQLIKTGAEIAEALDVAHRAAIVHRDLKPGNVMLIKTGAKLMDFGLAKPTGTSGSGISAAPLLSAAMTMTTPGPKASPLTTAGAIVGTIQYMSPEQIEGREADARSDIFALGAVLYEMAAGRRAFEGKSQLTLASAILEKEPESLKSVQPSLPRGLDDLVRICMSKDPEDRFASAHDVKLQLKRITAAPEEAPPATPALAPRKIPALIWIVAMAVALAAGFVGSKLRRSAPHDVVLTDIPGVPKAALELTGDQAAPPAISPDGKYMVIGASGKLWLRQMSTGAYSQLEGTAGAAFPFWSPDSRSVGFFADAKLQRIEIQGGAPIVLCPAQSSRGGTWGTDNIIVFSPSIQSPLSKVQANGGTPVAVTVVDTKQHSTHRWPYFLPDGKHFLYLAANHNDIKGAGNGIYLGSTDGNENRRLLHTASNAIYSAGRILYVQDGELMAQRFDAGSLALSGEPARLQQRVFNDLGIWRDLISVSDTGLLLYLQADAEMAGRVQWFSDSGQQIPSVPVPGGANPRLSPDGKRLAIEVGDPSPDIWVQDVDGSTRARVTNIGQSFSPVWSPDGKRMAFMRIGGEGATQPAGNLMIGPSDANGISEWVHSEPVFQYPVDWSSDGKYILFQRGDPGAGEIWVAEAHKDGKMFPIFQPQKRMSSGRFSPDTKWVAYEGVETGQPQIYITPFPGPGPRVQITTNGALGPRWRKDGKELYYYDFSGCVMAVAVTVTGEEIHVGNARKLFITLIGPDSFYSPAYDVSRDGKKFVVFGNSAGTQSPLRLLVNWDTLLAK